MNLADLLQNTAKRIPTRMAVRFEGEEITYRELNNRVNILAGGLSSLGLKHGDTCVLMMQPSLEFVTAYYALARMGVVLKPGAAVTVDDLRAFTRERVAPYKYPRVVHIVDDLPKSHTGKVLKRELWKQP